MLSIKYFLRLLSAECFCVAFADVLKSLRPSRAFMHVPIATYLQNMHAYYSTLHFLKFWLLPPPYGYTPAYAPAYWVRTSFDPCQVTEYYGNATEFEFRPAFINNAYEIQSVMIAPGLLLMRTPDEIKPWFARCDFQYIFGDNSTIVPGRLLLAEGVHAATPDYMVPKCAKTQCGYENEIG